VTIATADRPRVTAARHVRAIAALPFMNTVVIPTVMLVLWPPSRPEPALATLAAGIAGAILLACGASLVIHSVRLFIRSGKGTLAPWDPTHELVLTGAYRYVRNPMKSGLFLVLAGEALLTQSGALSIWLICFTVVNVVYIRAHEEPGLIKRFGQPYRDYCARVPAWWPRISRAKELA
jgi:protein-S-isoprenylcysteine O-methyltransferase Ste14